MTLLTRLSETLDPLTKDCTNLRSRVKCPYSDVPNRLFHFFLPIYVAGYYDEQDIKCTADYFVSVYTPTVSALFARPSAPSIHTFQFEDDGCGTN